MTYWTDGTHLFELLEAEPELVIIRDCRDETERILTAVEFAKDFQVVRPAKEPA